MRVEKASIQNVSVGLDRLDRMIARVTFHTKRRAYKMKFVLTKDFEAQRLMKLMSFIGTYNINNMDGKIVRVVIHKESFYGFGAPIEDKFVPTFGKGLRELTMEQFVELWNHE